MIKQERLEAHDQDDLEFDSDEDVEDCWFRGHKEYDIVLSYQFLVQRSSAHQRVGYMSGANS